MTEKAFDRIARTTAKNASSPSVGSDLNKVDAYVNTAPDYEEIPDLSGRDPAEGVFKRGGVPVMGRPPLGVRTKTQITLRLDPDVIEHFKNAGAGWQGRINAALRKSTEA